MPNALLGLLGLDPSYDIARSQADALPQVKSIFASLPDQLGVAQTADQNFNAIAPNNQSGPGAYSTAYRSALSQLASADPQDYAKAALTANDPSTMLDNSVKQATAQNIQADTQDKMAQTFDHQLIDMPDGNKARWNPSTGQLTPVYVNPYGAPPVSDQGKIAYDQKRGVFSHMSPLQSAVLNNGQPQGSQGNAGPVSSPQSTGISTPQGAATANGGSNLSDFYPPGVPPPKELLDAEGALRTQANNDENIKTFPTTQNFYNSIKTATSGTPTNQSDFRALYSYMKLVDPGQGVRPSQFEEEKEIPGLPQQVAAARNHLLNGGMLGDQQRQDMVKDATSLYRSAVQTANSSVDRWQQAASSFSPNPERVIPHFQDTSPQGQISQALPKLSVSDPRVIATAQKYNQTPQQVIDNLSKASK